MRITQPITNSRRRAFTLSEVLVAIGVSGIMFVSLYAAFSMGFTMMRVARENLQATQIMVQRGETVRLYTWSQLQDTNYFKTSFKTNYASLGTTYYGNIALNQPANMGTPSYLSDMRSLVLTVRWTNSVGKPQPHVRQMQTQVARYGLQNYIFGGHN